MISTFTAFFDANVFYGARLRSLVVTSAQTKLFRARWSDRVHDEWVRNLLKNRPDLKASDLDRTRALMNQAVPDCLIDGFDPLIEAVTLPDPDDRHVVAAAIIARADVIVTFNLKDFPAEAIAPFRLHTRHPDDFLIETFNLSPDVMAEAVIGDFLHYRTPPLTFTAYRDSLAAAGIPGFAKLIKPLEVLLPEE
ncbi:PIN domain-containing protein [Rhodobacter sp. JA431]|uniref:PIN domain-containing protein n=1 Tax=Rhodobacter sp. JA431 TaxID=570013 RepID=UPI000BC47A27|nr:PIN domain-containing protein [Rhodobacter sp. JA431]SOC03606.1 PIN domain-containing protein [Rhodobacter sp. JA431]